MEIDEKPNWEEIAKIAKPDDKKSGMVPRSTYAGCWSEGQMVGYAQAMIQFKKKFEERIAACDRLIESNPSGWPTVDLIARAIRAEFQSQLKQI